jgi:chemotaxis response regulator CheB
MKQERPGVPVVVVSRLPEASLWLNVLELGAADYCAAPFEIHSDQVGSAISTQVGGVSYNARA